MRIFIKDACWKLGRIPARWHARVFSHLEKNGPNSPHPDTQSMIAYPKGEFFRLGGNLQVTRLQALLFPRPRNKDTIPPVQIPYTDPMARKARQYTRPNIPSLTRHCGYGLAW